MIYVLAISQIDAIEKIQLNEISYNKELILNNLKKEKSSAARVGLVTQLKIYEINIKEIE